MLNDLNIRTCREEDFPKLERAVPTGLNRFHQKRFENQQRGQCAGVNYFLADGEAAGQEVFHIHLHIIPRFKDDGFGFKFPVEYGNMPTREELEAIGAGIKSSLN